MLPSELLLLGLVCDIELLEAHRAAVVGLRPYSRCCCAWDMEVEFSKSETGLPQRGEPEFCLNNDLLRRARLVVVGTFDWNGDCCWCLEGVARDEDIFVASAVVKGTVCQAVPWDGRSEVAPRSNPWWLALEIPWVDRRGQKLRRISKAVVEQTITFHAAIVCCHFN